MSENPELFSVQFELEFTADKSSLTKIFVRVGPYTDDIRDNDVVSAAEDFAWTKKRPENQDVQFRVRFDPPQPGTPPWVVNLVCSLLTIKLVGKDCKYATSVAPCPVE